MAWTAADIPALEAWLGEARTARHEIATGTKVSVWMDQNGERIEYSRANMSTLQAYIAELEATITQLKAGRTTSCAPLTFWM